MRNIFRKFAVSYPFGQAAPNRCRKWTAPQVYLAIWCAVSVTLAGCGEPEPSTPPDSVLIRTDRQTITKAQFERAFAAARIAYSDNRTVDPQQIEQARLRLLNQMTEEAIAERRADELGLVLEDQELEAAIQAIKKDYPDDEFEQMLLESAIPYSLWKDRMRVRLLMEKVVERDLIQPLVITAQEIEGYYKAHEDEFAVNKENPPEADLNHRIVERLRREKVEAAYPQWMDGLRKRYQVEINWELWGASDGADVESVGGKKE